MNEPKAYSYIRWSTAKQSDKDSERRQIEAAKAYADKNDLTLIPLRDPATSGYSGKHISKGELGKFLSRAQKGEIPKGSKLIFENVDRLTRLKIDEAQVMFIKLLQAGITLVPLDHGSEPEITLKDYQRNQGIVYQLTGEIYRAWKESDRKADTISDARKNERDQARKGERKISGMSPMWLDPIKNKKGAVIDYDPKDEHYKNEEGKPENVIGAIRLMFQMKKAGKGSYRIERELNQMDNIWKPPKSKRNKAGAWRRSTINRYLKDRRLRGEYQPHKYIKKPDGGRKRVKVGDLIPDNYPPVIDKDLFDNVQNILKQNSNKKGKAGGRTGKVSNLFVHLVKCGSCGDSMKHTNKGGGRSKLRCDDNDRGLGCDEDRKVRYDIFEPLLLQYCRGLDVSDIVPGDEQRQSRLAVLQNQLQSTKGELSQVEENIKNLVDKIEYGEEIEERFQQRKDQKAELKSRRSELEAEISKLNNATENAAQRLKDIKELIQHLEEVEGEEQINLRLNIRQKLRQLIRQIKVGFWVNEDEGLNHTVFDISFHDGARQIMELTNDKLDEVITIEKDGVTIQDIIRERQREANKKVKIADPRTEK